MKLNARVLISRNEPPNCALNRVISFPFDARTSQAFRGPDPRYLDSSPTGR